MPLEFKPIYHADKIKVINPQGHAGIVTLWSKPESVLARLMAAYPKLFESDSPLVALTSLYGNGLPQMLANLAYNPQIERIGVTGNDTEVVRSSDYLINFFQKGVAPIKKGEVELSQIRDTNFALDPQLHPGAFSSPPEISRFKAGDLEGLANFIYQARKRDPSEGQRVRISLAEPKFKDFPSDVTYHNIQAQTPLEAWMEVMFTLDRYGRNIVLPKGTRRALFNLDVNVLNPAFEDEELLKRFNFDPAELRSYQEQILASEKADDKSYTYGNRLRGYWGGDTLEKIIGMLKEDPKHRHGFTTLWDPRKDLLLGESAPCFTDAYFVNTEGRLMMTASFRTHNAVSAWLTNLYGLRAIQEKVASETGLTPGQINIRSRWIGIDPENAQAISALKIVDKNRKGPKVSSNPQRYFDPRGSFVIETEGGEIVAHHYSNEGLLLEEFRGKNAKEIKEQLWKLSAIADPDHAMWVGYELARAQLQLDGKIEEM